MNAVVQTVSLLSMNTLTHLFADWDRETKKKTEDVYVGTFNIHSGYWYPLKKVSVNKKKNGKSSHSKCTNHCLACQTRICDSFWALNL